MIEESILGTGMSCDPKFLNKILNSDENPESIEKLSVKFCSLEEDENVVDLVTTLHKNLDAAKLIGKVVDIVDEVSGTYS